MIAKKEDFMTWAKVKIAKYKYNIQLFTQLELRRNVIIEKEEERDVSKVREKKCHYIELRYQLFPTAIRRLVLTKMRPVS